MNRSAVAVLVSLPAALLAAVVGSILSGREFHALAALAFLMIPAVFFWGWRLRRAPGVRIAAFAGIPAASLVLIGISLPLYQAKMEPDTVGAPPVEPAPQPDMAPPPPPDTAGEAAPPTPGAIPGVIAGSDRGPFRARDRGVRRESEASRGGDCCPTGAPDSIEVQRYPSVEAPPRVALGREFSVQVSLTEELLTPEVGREPRSMELPSAESWPIEVVVSAPGFDFRDGVNTGTIVLPRDGDSTVVAFKMTARPADTNERRIHATFYHQGRFLFRANRPISVAAATTEDTTTPAVSRPDRRAPIDIALQGEAPDLSVEIVGGRILIRGRGLQLNNSPYQPPDQLDAFLQQNYARLGALRARGARPVDERGVTDTARGIGRELYRRFAPHSFKQALWLQYDRWGAEFRTIQIYSDDPRLPWELMVPTRTKDAQTEERDHLGLEFELSRWHARQDSDVVVAPPQQLAMSEIAIVWPRYRDPLPAVQREVENIRAFSPPGLTIRNVRGQKQQFREFLNVLPRGILHFAGHGVVARDDVRGARYTLLLEDDTEMTLDEWRGMLSLERSGRPFVFFNACDVGRSARVLDFVDGWAPAMLDAGASAYVGALWPVNDSAAAAFASRFYEILFRLQQEMGQASVLAAVHRARQLYKEAPDPSFLAYVYYGDSNLKIGSPQPR